MVSHKLLLMEIKKLMGQKSTITFYEGLKLKFESCYFDKILQNHEHFQIILS